ncbi:MFS transporter [Deinococcus sp. Arct2-2]|uniref:MFS transporter n=1 Tax=Deinococcus sp. Arct2-2 TaxID=2568653 RepID=UPI0010A4F2F6|nr:MFS transporter [Deinococcus sp. Arct2-2]THF71389.1 MFS transporter [Deinococcus sp. Arct2-2]
MSATTTPSPHADYLRLAPLYTAQALATGATTVSTVLASLVMSGLGSENLAGLPSTLISAAAALSAGAFGALMLRSGRRLGLGLAFALGAAGAVVGFAGARAGVVPLFLLGAVMMGGAQGGYQQARYAAAESVPESRRGTALGALMLMSVLGSFLMTGASGVVEGIGAGLGVSAEVGGWLMGGLLLAVAAVLMAFWKPLVAPVSAAVAVRLPLRAALATPGVRSTALAVAAAQGIMVTLMSLTPLRAHHEGMDHTGIAVLISGHILGMFGFGWLTGPLIDHFGLRLGYIGGSVLLVAAALTAPLAGSAWLGASMFLLGLGWNLAFVSGSKALTRFPAVQGVTDGLGYVAAGTGTLLGGFVIARAGFPPLAYACAVLALLPLVSAWRVRR